MSQNLMELLPRTDALALVAPNGHTLTFRELWSAVESTAATLAHRGIEPGDRVVVLVPMSIDLYVVLLAVFHRGATATLVDPAAEVQTLLSLHPPDAFIGVPKAHLLRLKIPALRGLKAYFSTGFTPLPHRRIRPHPEPLTTVEPGIFPALLTFTSGTTDTPKAMARSHGFLIGQHRVLHQHMAFGPGDVDLPTLPVFLLHSLASGATCVLADADLSQVGRVDADPLIAQINRLGITSTSGSPAFFRQLADKLNVRSETLPSVRHAFTGGARVSPELVDDLAAVLPNADIHIVYGSTECEPIAVLDAKAHRDALATTANGALVGRPVEAVTLRIDGEPVGEILVAGPHVNPGYVNNPEADRAHKLHEGGRIWHRTGDVGRIDERGMLWLVGRVGEAVNGLWPLAVEATVESLDFVVRAGLVECKDEAVLALELNAPPEDWAQRIGAMVNARPVAVDRIPVDARHNAKVDRRLLHEQLTQAL